MLGWARCAGHRMAAGGPRWTRPRCTRNPAPGVVDQRGGGFRAVLDRRRRGAVVPAAVPAAEPAAGGSPGPAAARAAAARRDRRRLQDLMYAKDLDGRYTFLNRAWPTPRPGPRRHAGPDRRGFVPAGGHAGPPGRAGRPSMAAEISREEVLDTPGGPRVSCSPPAAACSGIDGRLAGVFGIPRRRHHRCARIQEALRARERSTAPSSTRRSTASCCSTSDAALHRVQRRGLRAWAIPRRVRPADPARHQTAGPHLTGPGRIEALQGGASAWRPSKLPPPRRRQRARVELSYRALDIRGRRYLAGCGGHHRQTRPPTLSCTSSPRPSSRAASA